MKKEFKEEVSLKMEYNEIVKLNVILDILKVTTLEVEELEKLITLQCICIEKSKYYDICRNKIFESYQVSKLVDGSFDLGRKNLNSEEIVRKIVELSRSKTDINLSSNINFLDLHTFLKLCQESKLQVSDIVFLKKFIVKNEKIEEKP